MGLTYETPEHLIEEARIAELFGRICGRRLVKIPINNLGQHPVVDYQIYRGDRFTSYAEIKRRYRVFGEFSFILLSLRKVEIARGLGQSCIFIVQFDDRLVWADMLPKRPTSLRGRTDRGDPRDIEQCVMIGLSEFTVIQ